MSHRWPILISFSIGIAISLLRFGSAILHPDTVLLGGWDHPDSLSNHWLLVWMSEQLAAGETILHNEMYYVPVGDQPWLAGNGSVGFWMAPFLWVLGWPDGVPIGFSLLWGVTAIALYALCQEYAIRRWAALFPITLILCMPFLGQELSAARFSQVDILWLCMSWAGVMRLLRKPSWQMSVLTGVSVAITALMYWYYAWFFIMIVALVLLPIGLTKQKCRITPLMTAALVSILSISPVAVLFFEHWGEIPGTQELDFPSQEAIQSGLMTFPMRLVGPNLGSQSILSWLGVGLLMGSAIRQRMSSHTAGLFGIAIAFGLLSMGTHAPVFEFVYGLAPPLKRFWWPARHVLVFCIAVSLLAAQGVNALLTHTQQRGGPLRFIGLAALVPLTLWFQGQPLSTVTTPLSGAPLPYSELGALPEGGLIQLPLSPQVSSSQAPLYFQLYHQRPMLNGHAQWVDRVRPTLWDEHINAHPFLSDLQGYERRFGGKRLRFSANELEYLKTLGIRYVVLDPSLYPKDLAPMLRGLREGLTVLFGAPVHRHQSVLIWDVHAWTMRSEVALAEWQWPERLKLGDGSQPIRGPMPSNPYLLLETRK